MEKAKVAVVGSYAVGVTITCDQFPVAGQTVQGRNFELTDGGKGSNQAVAAHRMGGDVVYGTCIGRDAFGDMCIDLYDRENIDRSHIRYSTTGKSTGAGLVTVNKDGENEIVIGLEANNEFSADDIEAMMPDIKTCKVMLMQLEMPVETELYAAKKCHEEGIPFILNPAPFSPLPAEIFKYCDFVTPNQTEGRQMLHLSGDDSISDVEVGKRLCEQGIKNVIMTLGEGGALWVNAEGAKMIPGIKVKAVDTTGAGDTFSGAFAVAIAEGKKIEDAIRFANVAAGLAVTKYGVVESIPSRLEVEEKLKEENEK